MKTTIVTILFFLFFLSCTALGFADINDGLILYYSFDSNQGGSVVDDSGNGHYGTVYRAMYSDQGRFGGAYHFDGIDDYILAGNLGLHETGTISFWINSDVVENWRNPFSTDYAGWDDNIRFEINSLGYLSGGGHGLGRGDTFTRTLQPKRWYHVVYVWDQNYVYGYLDGDFMFKNPHPDPNSYVHPNLPLTAGQYKQMTLNFRNVAIGNGYSTDSSRYWEGFVDEVRIYNRPLSTSEILTLYRGEEDGLMLHYSFDRNDGAVVRDDSGNGHIGTVQGAAYTTQGKDGGAYIFDGIDDDIFIPRSKMLKLGKNLTLAAWYKAYDTAQGPIIEWSNGTKSGAHMWINATATQWQGKGTGANLVDNTTAGLDHIISTTNLSVNQWHHIAVTYDGKTGNALLYLDGIRLLSKNLGVFIPQTAFDLFIGRRPPQGPSFKGVLDDIRVYNRILTGLEIRRLYDSLSHGLIYQDFELQNGSDPYGWAINGATVGQSSERIHSGSRSWKFTIPAGLPSGVLGGTAVAAQIQRWHTNFEKNRHDRLSFWIWTDPSNNAPNTVAVKFFDHNKYVYDPAHGKDGFLVWTTRPAEVKKWTQLSVLFTQLPSDFQLNDVDKIEFYNYWYGTYYLDDINVVGNDRSYQTFEPWACSSSNPGDCAWAWNGAASIATTARESSQSLKLVTTDYFGGAGIKSQEKRCDSAQNCTAQDYWHVNLAPQAISPQQYDRLTFWVKEYGQNRLANNVAVKFFDHGNYSLNGQEIWTAQTAEYGQWSRLSVPFSSLPKDFNLQDINKIELMVYWPGTYYFDDIWAIKAEPPAIEKTYLASGIVTWKPLPGAARYTLQQSNSSSNGPWTTIYSGPDNLVTISRLSKAWLRLRWETAANTSNGAVAYNSDWSDTVEYQPRSVLVKKEELIQQGAVEWTFIPQTGYYEVQEGNSKSGPWQTIYLGTYKVPPPISATLGKYYRARGIKQDASGAIIESGAWSPALLYDPNAFVKADGQVLKEKGTGPVVSLRGVNLGSDLLIEPWMFFGDNNPLIQTYPDDYSIWRSLTNRADIGPEKAKALKDLYQQTYIQECDFDNLLAMGVNFIRLPIYAQNIRPLDDNGQWLTSNFDFSAIDRIVKYCADRGIYVLLDLHGAPGYQSKEYHTGRRNQNKLFNPTNDIFRQRTVELWKALALHYRANTAIVGYDLLNEPSGAVTPQYYPIITDGYRALWDLYNRIYSVIRKPEIQGGAADTNHIIVIEGIPSNDDWATVPNPSTYAWTNVMYQFHYYGFKFDSSGNIIGTMNYAETLQYLNGKISKSKQSLYRVPVIIGEFNGFNDAAIWELYLRNFNALNWSWGLWSYKSHDYPSEWGLYNHSLYAQTLPDFNRDGYADLEKKIQDYDTVNHHTPNLSLIQRVSYYANLPGYIPNLKAAKGNGSVTLTWSAPYSATPITLYRVRYGTTSSGSFNYVFTDDSSPGAKITGLPNGVEYRFRVEAVNSAGTGPQSNIAAATPSL